MAFNLDSLTTDPSQRGAIYKETNQSLVNYAKNAQSQLDQLQTNNQELREIEASEFMVDKIADQQAAKNIVNMIDSTGSALQGVDSSMQLLNATFSTQVARLTDLQDLLSRPNDLAPEDLKAAEKEFKKLDQQTYKTQQTAMAAQAMRNNIQGASAQAIEIYANRHAITKQARDNNEQVARTMTLRNRQAAIDEVLKSDATILQAIQSRQVLNPGEADQQTKDGMDMFESMYFAVHNGENMKGFGIKQSRDMQSVYAGMSPDEQRAAALFSTQYMRSKYSGVPMDISQYKEQLAENGETGALELVAKLSGDRDLEDTIKMGKRELFNRRYSEVSAQALAELPVSERVNGLSDQRLRQITAQVAQEVSDTNNRDVLPAALDAVSRDVTNNTNLRGQEIFSSVAEGGDELLSPLMFPEPIRQYFQSDEARQIMLTPNVESASPILETANKLVQSMQRQNIKGPEAVIAVSNLMSQASKASYKTRKDFGQNQHSTSLQTLERVGYGMNPQVLIPPPSSRGVPASRAGVQAWDAGNPTDLQEALGYLQRFKASATNKKMDVQRGVAEYGGINPLIGPR